MQISCTSKNLDIHHNRVYHRHMAQGRQTVFWCEFGLQIKRIEYRCLRYNLEESRVNTFGLAQHLTSSLPQRSQGLRDAPKVHSRRRRSTSILSAVSI
jgi:hypothetical protein